MIYSKYLVSFAPAQGQTGSYQKLEASQNFRIVPQLHEITRTQDCNRVAHITNSPTEIYSYESCPIALLHNSVDLIACCLLQLHFLVKVLRDSA